MSLNEKQLKLLNNLEEDRKHINKKLYSAGPYWDSKTKKIVFWLKKNGVYNFRSKNSGVGTSYTDNYVKDVRNEFNFKGRLASLFTQIPIIKAIFSSQVNITDNYINALIKSEQINFINNPKVISLISEYNIDDSTEFGCISKFKFNNKEFSMHYLHICERMDNINKLFNLNNISSCLEIGGGFGSNIHLMLNNFKKLKKIIYVDISPNLVVGTEYLRKFFKESVIDYSDLRKKKIFNFEDNDKLEIICIPPWKLDKIKCKIDFLCNSGSFQEMTAEQVKNYKNIINNNFNPNFINLTIHERKGKEGTLTHDDINRIFENRLKYREYKSFKGNRVIHYLSTK